VLLLIKVTLAIQIRANRERQILASLHQCYFDEKDVANLKMMGNKYPFVADAIIANPPSFAHFHCAEKLGGKSSPNRTFRDSIPACNPISGVTGSEA
jgi:hypothetical protein